MATFKDRIEDLAGTIPATADGEQFLKDGVVDVVHRTISAHPQHMSLFSKEQSIESAGSSVHDVHVSEVTRSGTACREIPSAGRHAAADTNSLHYASTDDPVYYFLNEKIHILPEGGGSCSILEHGTVSNWDSGTSSISYMPSHHYNQVIMYAGIQTLHHKMVEMNSNTDIDTAFTAVNTELDETQASCDLINTQVDAAVVELAEAGTQVDASIDTALAAIVTATGRINTAVGLANDEFDKCDTILDKGEVDSEGDVNTAAAKIVTELDETQSKCDLMDAEIVLAKAEVADALAEIAEAIGLTDSSSSDIKTAVDAMKTANAKFRADGSDPALFGDDSTYTTADSAMTNVKTYVDRAITYINGNFYSR